MTTLYEAIEIGVKDRLLSFPALFPSNVVKVDVWPESDSNFTPPAGVTTTVYVMVTGSDPSDLRSPSIVTQERTLSIAVFIDSKKIRGENNLYDVAEKVRRALSGYSGLPLTCSHLVPGKLEMMPIKESQRHGNYSAAYHFTTTVLEIETPDEQDFPLFQELGQNQGIPEANENTIITAQPDGGALIAPGTGALISTETP